MADIVTARVTRRIEALTPVEIYHAWLDPARLRVWMGAPPPGSDTPRAIRRLETDPRVGGRFHFADMREDGLAEAFGSYLALERPDRLAFTWFTSAEEEHDEHSVVRIEIAAATNGAVVTLCHEMGAQWADYLAPTEAAWAHMLGNLDRYRGGV